MPVISLANLPGDKIHHRGLSHQLLTLLYCKSPLAQQKFGADDHSDSFWSYHPEIPRSTIETLVTAYKQVIDFYLLPDISKCPKTTCYKKIRKKSQM